MRRSRRATTHESYWGALGIPEPMPCGGTTVHKKQAVP